MLYISYLCSALDWIQRSTVVINMLSLFMNAVIILDDY